MSSGNMHFINPFPGLRPFRSDEHHLFFGREEQTAALLQLLRKNRFLAVVGTSGSGKSSLVRAGMIAALHGGTMTHAGSTWEVMILRPGGSPIDNLARAMVDADLYDAEDPNSLPRLKATLSRSRFGLVEAMKQSDAFEEGTNLLVVVDQFEELFRFRQQSIDSEEAAAAFVNLLLTASKQAECPIYVTITMRSDYLGDCSEIPGLAEAVNDGEYLIPRLLRDQKRDAIEKPIGVGGAKISPLLVQRLLNDVGDDSDQLPVLQHALMRTFDYWSERGEPNRPIELADFEATGGLASALSNHADEIYDSLPGPSHREACEKVFKTLTEKGDDNRGIRRPTRLAQLQAIAETDQQTIVEVLDAFRQSGVTFLMPGEEVELTDRTVVDLSHESLMRCWERLRGWVEEEAQSARIFRRLLDTARLWSDGKAGLFRDPDLQIAISWRESEKPNQAWADQYGGHFDEAVAFLDTSNADAESERQAKEESRKRELEQARQLAEARQLQLEHQQRTAAKLRRLIAGVAGVAMIAAVACVIAMIAHQRANRLAEVAEVEAANSRLSAEQALAAQRETKLALEQVEAQKEQIQESLETAERAERIALDAEERGRELLYATDMQLAAQLWRDEQVGAKQLQDQLAAHMPKDDKPDLRGFEWYYAKHLLDSSGEVFPVDDGEIFDTALSEDGLLLILDDQGRLRRWDRKTGSEVGAPLELTEGRAVQVAALSRNGRLLANADDTTIELFDTATGEQLFELAADDRTYDLIFSPDARMLITVGNNVRWWNTQSGQVIASVSSAITRSPRALSISADGMTLAASAMRGSYGDHVTLFQMDLASKSINVSDHSFGGTRGPIALSPDGELFATCLWSEGPVSVYETSGFRNVVTNDTAHAAPLSTMAFSADGTRLITADENGMIKVWNDPRTLESPQFTLKGHIGPIRKVDFSADGTRLVSAGTDQTARIWALPQSGTIRALDLAAGHVSAQQVQFSPDGLLIGAADESNRLSIWDAATGNRLRRLPGDDQGDIYSIAFSPDNRLVAAGFGGGANVSSIVLWNLDTGQRVAVLPGTTDLLTVTTTDRTGVVNTLEFSPDGRFLVAGFGTAYLFARSGYPIPLKVWDVGSWQVVRHLAGHQGLGTCLTFSADGSRLATGNYDGTARIWDTSTWKTLQTLQNPGSGQSSSTYVRDVAFSPDGQTLAMAEVGGNIHLWDVDTGQLRQSLTGHSNSVTSVAYSPDGLTLASASSDETVRLWNVATSRELLQLDFGDTPASDNAGALSFSPDGRQLLFGGTAVALWSTAPPLWNDPDRAAEELARLRDSATDFRSWIRMFSVHVQLHEALARLQQQRQDDVLVQTALAAAQAHWHAWREEWSASAEAVERLVALSPENANEWLSTEALLRVATALVHQNKIARAAAFLIGGAERRKTDGLAALSRDNVTGEKTRDETVWSLWTLINEKLKEDPQNPELLEVRAELAGQWSDTDQQLADYTAAIEVFSTLPPDEANASLMRLVHRRGDVYFATNNWQAALDDYDRIVADETTDVVVLTNHAMARSLGLIDGTWTVLKPTQWKSEGGATLTLLEDNSILASGFNPDQDAYEITANAPLQRITAIRLEVMPDPSLPKNGPGRYSGNGNLHLNEFRVLVNGTPHQISGIYLSHQDPNVKAEHQKIIDGIVDQNHWSIYPRSGERHFAFFATDIKLAEDDTLTLEMVSSRGSFSQHHVGRFRLSVSDDPNAFVNTEERLNAEDLDDPWARLASAYQLEGNEQEIEQLVQRLPRAAVAFGDLHAGEEDFERAIDFYNIALAVESSDADLLSKRARALEQISDWPSAATDWARAAAISPQGAELLAEFAHRLLTNGQVDLATEQSLAAQRIYEESLNRDPGNTIVAETLAAFLLKSIVDRTSITPTSETRAITWQWTTKRPGDDWMTVEFDDSNWNSGPGGFGTSGTANSVVRTIWNTNDIWLRRTFEYSSDQAGEDLAFRYHHDDEMEVYLNGKQVLALPRWTGAYENIPLDDVAVDALHYGTNTIAVHCHQGAGGQYIDIGVTVGEPSPATKRAAEVAKLSDPTLRLAAAYAVSGNVKPAAIWFGRTFDEADSQVARAKIVEELEHHDEVLAAVLRERPDDLLLQLARASNLAMQSNEDSDQSLAEEIFQELSQVWENLDRVLSKFPETEWTILKPTQFESAGGATLTLQDDGSILASGFLADDEVYSVTLPLTQSLVTAIRLETFPDPALPFAGSGREPKSGSFLVSEIGLEALGDDNSSAIQIAIENSFADAELTNVKYDRSSRKLIDGNPLTHWTTYPNQRQPHFVVLQLQDPIQKIGESSIRITLDCRDRVWKQHALGRFRISATSSPNPIDTEVQRATLPDNELAEVAGALGRTYGERGQLTEAETYFQTAIEMAGDRAVKQKIIAQSMGFGELLENMAQHFHDDGQFQAAVAQKYLSLGETELASAARERARTLLQADFMNAPDDAELAEQLAGFLLSDDTTQWTILEPIEMTSEGGATLTKLADNSILAGGKNPLGDVYSIVAQSSANRVSVIRLEALTDPSLPAGGPGRDESADRGNFHMINWEVAARAAGTEGLPIPLSQAASDFNVSHIPLSVKEWNVGGGASRPHTAVYLLQEPMDFEPSVPLQFRMEFSSNASWPLQNLGRFRFSVSDDATAFEHASQRFAAMKLNDAWSKLALAYYLDGDTTAAEAILDQHPEAAMALADQYVASQDWKGAIDSYSRMITDETSDPELLLKRANSYEQIEDWDAAAADMSRAAVELLGDGNQHELAFETFKKAGRWSEATTFGWMLIEKNPENKYVWLRLAPVLVLAGDTTGYQEFCRRYVDQFRDMTDGGTADVVCKACLLQPGGIELAELPYNDLVRALDSGTTDTGLSSWFWAGRGLFAYRSGDAVSAVKYAQESQQHSPADMTLALALAVQALGQQQLGEVDAARASTESADQLIDRLKLNSTNIVLHDLLIPEILLTEAKAIIAGEIDPNAPTGIRAAQRTSDGTFLSQAIAQYSQSITEGSADFEALTQRARLYEQVRDWDAAAADWSRAAVTRPAGIPLLIEFADRLQAKGQSDSAETHLQKARQAYEVVLENDPEDYLVAEALTELLTNETGNKGWSTLRPIEATSQQGATLTPQDDGSVLASGPHVSGDTYTIVAQGDLDVAEIRLEVLPDESLPNNGPGRHPSGNFQLSEFRLLRSTVDDANSQLPIPLRSATASYAFTANNVDIAATIDEKVNKVWHVWGRTGEQHSARYTLQEPISLGQEDRLIVVLKFKDTEGGINLGRFRLSFIDDLTDREKLARMPDTWARLAAAYHLRGNQAAIARLVEHHPSATSGIGDLLAAEGAWQEAISLYDQAFAAAPSDASVLSNRARAYEQIQNTDAAAADWVLAAQLDSSLQQSVFDKLKQQSRWRDAANVGWMLIEKEPSNSNFWLDQAPIVALTDDNVAYRDYCRRFLRQFSDKIDAQMAERICKLSLLLPDAVDMTQLPVATMTQPLDDGSTPDWLQPWAWFARALVAYRGGDAESAAKYAKESQQHAPSEMCQALNLSMLALAYQQLGDPNASHDFFEQATQLVDRLLEDESKRGDHDLMMAQIFMREYRDREPAAE